MRDNIAFKQKILRRCKLKYYIFETRYYVFKIFCCIRNEHTTNNSLQIGLANGDNQ